MSVLGDYDRLLRKSLMDGLQTAPQIFWRTFGPALEIFVTFDKVHQRAHVFSRRLLQRIRGIGAKTTGIEFFRLGIKSLRKLICGRVLSANLVAQSPGDNRGMVAVALDHLL